MIKATLSISLPIFPHSLVSMSIIVKILTYESLPIAELSNVLVTVAELVLA